MRGPKSKHEQHEFGRILRELRAQAGLTQAQTAERAQVSNGYIGLVETGMRGARMSLGKVQRLAQALNASPADTDRMLRATGHIDTDESVVQPERPSFRQFLMADRRLTAEQWRLLVGIYESWIRPDKQESGFSEEGEQDPMPTVASPVHSCKSALSGGPSTVVGPADLTVIVCRSNHDDRCRRSLSCEERQIDVCSAAAAIADEA
jgi:transcriptional regulator with XRE-family HTH domain